jgi:hypothetical protein
LLGEKENDDLRVTVGRGAEPAGGAEVWFARYIPHAVEVTIPRGENGGHTLPYQHVVREMVLLGKWRGEAARFPAPDGDASLAAAAIVQGSGSGPIIVAAKSRGSMNRLGLSFPRKRESGGAGKSGCPLSRA